MGKVSDLKGVTLDNLDPKHILAKVAKEKLAYVLVLGWDEDDNFIVASSSGDLQAANYVASRIITWIHTKQDDDESLEDIAS